MELSTINCFADY